MKQIHIKGVKIMRDEYDFSNAIKNPYSKQQKATVTIRLDSSTIEYFKNLSEKVNIPYQTLINSYLTDCAVNKKQPVFSWE